MSKYIPSGYADDHPINWAGHMVKNGPRKAHDRLMDYAQSILKDEDLSEKGKAKLIAKQAATLVQEFRSRQADIAKDLSDARVAVAGRRTAKVPAIDPTEKLGIAAWLRGLLLPERNAVLRDAAAGRMAGSETVMAAVLASFPRLLGYKDEDPTYSMVREEFITRLNPQCSGELSDLDAAEAALKAAGEELEYLVKEIAPEWQSALNEKEGRTDWGDLTTAEKSAAVAQGQDIGSLMKSGMIVDREEASEGWDASKPLADKVQMVEDRGPSVVRFKKGV